MLHLKFPEFPHDPLLAGKLHRSPRRRLARLSHGVVAK
jgi:hypothetical protein